MEIRPNTMDEYVVKEQKQYAPMLGIAGADVLDIGGNIGAFACWAIDQGAAHVTSYEPEPDNFRLLVENTKGLSASCVRGAVVPHQRGSDRLYVNGGKNKGAHSLHVKRGREAIGVSAYYFPDVVACGYDVVKCDIEGGEYGLQWEQLPAQVRVVAIEMHLNQKNWRLVEAPVLIERMALAGFDAVREPKITESNWYTLGVWKR